MRSLLLKADIGIGISIMVLISCFSFFFFFFQVTRIHCNCYEIAGRRVNAILHSSCSDTTKLGKGQDAAECLEALQSDLKSWFSQLLTSSS